MLIKLAVHLKRRRDKDFDYVGQLQILKRVTVNLLQTFFLTPTCAVKILSYYWTRKQKSLLGGKTINATIF